MTIQELSNKINQYLSAGRLTLPGTATGFENIQKLFTDFLPSQQLVIDSATATSTDTQVVVTGQSSILGIANAQVEARFFLSQDQVELILTVQPGSWKFSNSFPALANTLFDRLDLSNAVFILASAPHVESGLAAPLVAGLNFSADLHVASLLASASWLLKDLPSIKIYGPIAIKNALPVVTLQGNAVPGISLGFLTLNVELRLVSEIIPSFTPNRTAILTTKALLLSNVTFQQGQSQNVLPISACLTGGGLLSFNADVSGISVSELGQLSSLLNGADLNILPPEIPLGSLAMSELGFIVSPATKQLTSINLGIKSDKPWPLVEDLLVIEDLAVKFMVVNPTDSSARTVYCNVFGKLDMNGVVLNTSLSIPDTEIVAELSAGSIVDLTTLLLNFFPAIQGMPALEVDVLSVRVALSSQAFSLNASIISNWDISLGIADLQLQSLFLSITGSGKQYTGSIFATANVAGALVSIGADVQQQLELRGTISNINFSAIAQKFLAGASLPDEVPDIQFSSIDLSFIPQTGAFNLTGKSTTTWELPFGVSGLSVSTVDLVLQRRPASGTGGQQTGSQLTCSLTLHSQGPVTIIDGLTFQNMMLTFDLDQQAHSWSLSGSITASVFDASWTLAVGLQQTSTVRTITLAATVDSSRPLIDLGSGSLNAKNLSITISKSLQPGSGVIGVSMNPSSPYTWAVSATGGFTVPDVFTLNGTLVLQKTGSSSSLVFTPTDDYVAIPMQPLQALKAYLTLASLSIVGTKDSTGKTSWTFDTEVDAWFDGLPASLKSVVPSDKTNAVKGHFKADSQEILIAADSLVQLQDFALPKAQLGPRTLDLGTAAVEVKQLQLSLGKNISLSTDFGIGLPQEMNSIFGTKDDGSPAVQFFNTYQPGNESTIIRFKLGLDSTTGLQVQLMTSPLKAITFESDGKDTWCSADLGEFGAIRFMLPVFGYSGGSFSGRGSFKQTRELKLPLTPLALLLKACHLDALANVLPRGLPLREIKIYDKQSGHFDAVTFIQTLEELGGSSFSLDDTIKQGLRALESELEKLPDSFKDYLDIVIPQEFSFSLSVTETGSFQCSISVDQSTPIKVLYSAMGILGPQLNGLTLYSFSIGEMLNGSLLLINLDMVQHQFNLVTLLAALALPLDKLPILPRSQDLLTSTIVHNLFMVIIYEGIIPIPVPLFFDQLGLEYLGLEGLALQTHWSFPDPRERVGISDFTKLLTSLERFFTDRNYLLDAGTIPNVLPSLTIGPHYLGLPPYLSGKTLGSTNPNDIITVDNTANLAHLLNALKTLSLDEIVQALPLKNRTGNEQISFACMTLNAAWLITTPAEFRATSYQALNIVDTAIEPVLKVVPQTPGKDEQGLILFLKGAWAIAGGFSLDATFGLIGTKAGFSTGIHVAGSISNLLATELQGVVVIDPNTSPAFRLDGHSSLSIAQRSIFSGDVQIDDQHFYLQGQLNLFPASSPLQVSGNGQVQIDNQGHVNLQTAVNVSLQNFVLVGSAIAMTNTSVEISGTWLGRTITLQIIVQGNDFTFIATVAFLVGINVNIGPIADKVTGLKVVDQLALNATANASFSVTLGTHGFAADVTASVAWNSYTLNLATFHISVSPQNVEEIASMLEQQVSQQASNLFTTIFPNMTAWLRAATAGLVQLTSQLAPAVAAAKQWSAAAWRATEQWSAQAWQAAYQWNANAWNATTHWSDTAWNATTHWSTDTWNATTHWSNDTWNATTRLSDTAWNESAHWTTDQWNRLGNLVTQGHLDTWVVPPVNIFSPHLDSPVIPHVDSASTHVDTVVIPHADSHTDTFFGSAHFDTPSSGHTDVSTPHLDTPSTPHGDSTPHIDTAGSGHLDVP